jgi:hypothetical protein
MRALVDARVRACDAQKALVEELGTANAALREALAVERAAGRAIKRTSAAANDSQDVDSDAREDSEVLVTVIDSDEDEDRDEDADGGEEVEGATTSEASPTRKPTRMLFSQAEIEQVFVENARLKAASTTLEETLRQQRESHARLRATVESLVADLETRPPATYTAAVEAKLETADAKNHALTRAVNKLTAEYNAVSVAHSYSNAELSRQRDRHETAPAKLRYKDNMSFGGRRPMLNPKSVNNTSMTAANKGRGNGESSAPGARIVSVLGTVPQNVLNNRNRHHSTSH